MHPPSSTLTSIPADTINCITYLRPSISASVYATLLKLPNSILLIFESSMKLLFSRLLSTLNGLLPIAIEKKQNKMNN